MVHDPGEVGAAIDCDELERALDAYLDGELAPPEEAEASAHLASCERCRALAGEESRLRSALRARLRAVMGPGAEGGRAPEALRARIAVALAGERRPLPGRLLAPLPLGVLAACAAGLLVLLFTRGRSDRLVEEAVTRHSRDLPLEVSAAAAGPDSVARWFAGKLDFNPAPPQFRGPEVHLVGGRLSHLLDRPAAYVRYDLPRGHLGLFILDDPGRSLREVGRPLQAGPVQVRVVNDRGFNVAIWRRNAIVYSLVSDLEPGDLVKLVEASQPAAAAP